MIDEVGSPAWRQNRFYAVPKSIPAISKLLKSIAFAEKVNMHISSSGMKLTVEEAKCIQVCVFLRKELFQIFHLEDDEDLPFKISLKELLECLKRMSPDGSRHTSRTLDSTSGTKMYFVIGRNENEFKMILEEDAAESYFRIRVEEYDTLIDFELVPVVVKIMMKAQEVAEYFKVLEDVSPEIIGCKVGPQENLVISADCQEGSVELILPSSADVVESFECSQGVRANFKLSNIRHAVKIMALSSKCALKMDPRGILNFCFLIDEETESFVEYFCLPQIAGTDDDLDI